MHLWVPERVRWCCTAPGCVREQACVPLSKHRDLRRLKPQEYRAQLTKFAAYYQRHRRRLPFLVWRDASVPHFNSATGAIRASVVSRAGLHLSAL